MGEISGRLKTEFSFTTSLGLLSVSWDLLCEKNSIEQVATISDMRIKTLFEVEVLLLTDTKDQQVSDKCLYG